MEGLILMISRFALEIKSSLKKVYISDKSMERKKNHRSAHMKDVGIRFLILHEDSVYSIQRGLKEKQKQC